MVMLKTGGGAASVATDVSTPVFEDLRELGGEFLYSGSSESRRCWRSSLVRSRRTQKNVKVVPKTTMVTVELQ